MILHLETDASLCQRHGARGADRRWRAPGGAGVVIRTMGIEMLAMFAVSLGDVGSTVHAEGLALEFGLERVLARGATGVRVRVDSTDLVRLVSGETSSPSPDIEGMAERLRQLTRRFDPFDLRWARSTHVTRRGDGALSADALAKIGSGVLRPRALPAGVKVEKWAAER
ncbi:MAG: reverse transcriptase-like protein [Euryarchaeota archaeon]|nr:reverse transcriptase-like protein [Euryarchaeota archaeon]MDE1837187.1 reverse transcriptase-like protein [Euryarchaeota archaeon]MDE1881687.1 reverse transcriptase-like protein [Euryarchaeota archaeon]MDE2045343.1 reverse transcriptase-like protein [Thermoplasmata archaeon]